MTRQPMKHQILAVILWAATAVLSAGTGRAEVIPTPKDKVGHVVMGMATYGGCRLLSYEPETCLNVAIGVAIAKEAYDYTQPQKHSTELMDGAATAVGGLLMFTIERRFD